MIFNDFCKTNIEFLNPEEFKRQIVESEYERKLFILSESGAKRFGLDTFIQSFDSKKTMWIRDSVSYPTAQMIAKGLEEMGSFCPDVIIAIGGGSSIDYAKCIKAFFSPNECHSEESVLQMLKDKTYKKNNIDIWAVPTTSGTGSEVTKWATVWNLDATKKYSVDAQELKPDKAVFVCEYLTKMSVELTIMTGLDSLSHAIESYWAKATNPMVKELDLQSIRTTLEYLPKVINEPDNLNYREKMAVASLISGLAFSVTRTTACHSISYPLTMLFNIPHGVATSMTLVEVMNKNSGTYVGEEELVGLFDEYGGLKKFLDKVSDDIIKLKLRDYGVSKDDISNIVKSTFTVGRMDNNPVMFTETDVREILNVIY